MTSIRLVIRRSFVSATSKTLGILQHEWIVQGKVTSDGYPMTCARNSMNNPPPTIQKTVIILHGLLGNSKNLRNVAKRLTTDNPHMSAFLLDLRGHGETARYSSSNTANQNHSSSSSLFLPPHSIQSCSLDIVDTLTSHGLTGPQYSPWAILGHSLGGRVALQYLHDTLSSFQDDTQSHDTTRRRILPPKQTWILDSVPGIAHTGVSQVIQAVSSIPMPISSKKELVTSLLQLGIDSTIASWMTTNLKESSSPKINSYNNSMMYDFTFDLNIAQEILHNFTNHDLFQILQESLLKIQEEDESIDLTQKKNDDNHHHKEQVYLIQGGKNVSWTREIIQQMDTIQRLHPRLFQRFVLPNAGHWVHVDDLNGLMNIILLKMKTRL